MRYLIAIFLFTGSLQAASVVKNLAIVGNNDVVFQMTYNDVTNTMSGLRVINYTAFPAAYYVTSFGNIASSTFTCAATSTTTIPISGTVNITDANTDNFGTLHGSFVWPK